MAPLSDSRPFAEAAAFYAPFRPPYGDEAVDHICRELRLDRGSRVLDLGCGPGILAVAIAPRVGQVVALDPEPEMLAQGGARAATAGVANIQWIEGRAEDIEAHLGLFAAAVMGQSFHWMDRDEVLRRLAPLLHDDGGLALVNPAAPRLQQPVESWEPIAKPIVEAFLGERPHHRLANPELKNEPALERSPDFGPPQFTIFDVTVTREIPSILGCIYSMSVSPPSAFGDRRHAFEAELRAALRDAAPDGRFVETIEIEVTIARKRPA